MAVSTPVNLDDPGLEVGTFFVRNRNALLARADLGQLYVDYYLHLSDHSIKYTAVQDRLFKRALAGFVLHCASRPRNELTAWTLHFEASRVNVFLTCDNELGAVTGRLFDEDVKEMGGNFFYADVIRGTQPKRRSVAQFVGEDPLLAIEAFYANSEQRGLRTFALADEEFALLSEHPDCDLPWLRSLDLAGARALDATETVNSLEKRIFRWHCGCNLERMMEVLAPVFRDDPEGVFGSDTRIEMRCPRCGARHGITREAVEAFVSSGDK